MRCNRSFCTLVREHGAAALLADANWCRGLLNEHGITQHLLKDELLTERLREVNLLVSAVEEGVAAELHAVRPGKPSAALRTRLAERLRAHCDCDEREARWAVESWT